METGTYTIPWDELFYSLFRRVYVLCSSYDPVSVAVSIFISHMFREEPG
jgi:hypothetical protein